MKHTCFRILGPIQAWSEGSEVDLGPRGHRLVLGVLLTEIDRYVTVERLVSVLWQTQPPASARGIIHSRISVLRRALRTSGSLGSQAHIERKGNSYRIQCDPDLVDANRFTSLVAQAMAAQTDERRAAMLRRALQLWHGPVLEGSLGEGVHLGAALKSGRLNATEMLFDTELTLGNHTRLIDEILRAMAEHPVHERFVEQCMVAMVRSGRATEALTAYDTYRRRLVDELGLDPGKSIQQLQRKVLTGDGSPAHGPAATGPTLPRPAQLPADVEGFAGRGEQLRLLDQRLKRTTHDGPGRVVAIVGPAGAGKTSLAVHWAYRNRARFADGQLFVDLRGYGADNPLTQEVVLERFLQALGVPPESIPSDPDDRAATFRSTLAERRVLIVLDNAKSTAQIRRLLPGAGPCVTVITSRDRLDGLVATQGTTRIELGALSPPEATELIERSCGLTDNELASRLADLCGGLPLALRIAAARLTRAANDVDQILSELSDLRTRLTGLTADEEISVRSALDGSTRALAPDLRRTFRLIALHPGPRISVPACAALTELDTTVAREHLLALAQIHLTKPDGDGHFVLHDLVKVYADELSRKDDSPSTREGALRRILVWYRDTANAADRRLRPSERPNFPECGEASFETEADALAWLDEESPALVSAAMRAGTSHPRLAWQIAAAMYGWLTRRSRRSQWIELYERAAQWAVSSRDPTGQAMITGRLAIPHSLLNNTDQAAQACRTAHDIRVKHGDSLGAATALLNLGAVYLNASRLEEAILELRRATALGRDLPGNGHLMAMIDSNLAEAQRLAGRPELSIESYAKAVANGMGRLPDRDIAHLLIGSAGAYRDVGDHAAAASECERGYELALRNGDRALAAEAQAELGRIHLSKGDGDRARMHLEEALSAMEELGHRGVPELRRLLAGQKHW